MYTHTYVHGSGLVGNKGVYCVEVIFPSLPIMDAESRVQEVSHRPLH